DTAVFIEAEQPRCRRLALNRRGWIFDGIEIGNGRLLGGRWDRLLEERVERALNELRRVGQGCLLFQQGIMFGESLSHLWRPRGQIAGEQARAPPSPVEGLATNAVGLTDAWDVAAPRHAPNQIPGDAGIVGRVERAGHIEANIR